MPALVAFGRRWYFASDDFFVPGLLDLVIRIAWLAAAGISAIYWRDTEVDLNCQGGSHIKIYLYGIFTILHAIIIVDAFLIYNTARGGMMDEYSRRHVPMCLYFRVFFMAVEIMWTCAGSLWWFTGSMTCLTTPIAETFARDRVISSWLSIIIWNVILVIMFDPTGRSSLTRRWEWKLRLYFFNSFTGNRTMINEGFEEAGHILDLFSEDTDLAPTDYIAGLVLLVYKFMSQQRQNLVEIKEKRKLRSIEHGHIEPVPPAITMQPLSTNCPVPPEKWNSVSMICHIKKYSIAVYAWKTLVFGHSDPIKKLWRGCFCGCFSCRNYPIDVEGDDCCFLGTSAIKAMVKIDDSDIIFVTFKNEVFETPFFVAVDHETKSVVVALRGSMSINDIMVNITAKPHRIDVPGLPESFTAHHGFYRCAQMVKQKLESLNTLPKLFAKYPDYGLALTGTSLGAGVSTILGILLRAEYPSVKCYAFAPPGLLLSLEAAEYCESFVVSVVYENDVVPRVSPTSLETLKYQLVSAVNTCNVPKYKVIFGGFFWYWFNVGFPNVTNDDNGSNLDDGNAYQPITNSTQHISIEIDNENRRDSITNPSNGSQAATNGPRVKKLLPFEHMYPPGIILFITESEDYDLGHGKPISNCSPRWNMRWAPRTEFREIVLSPRIIADHMPFRMYKALKYYSKMATNREHETT